MFDVYKLKLFNQRSVVKGCDSYVEVDIFLLQMKHLPCIKQYVLGKRM